MREESNFFAPEIESLSIFVFACKGSKFRNVIKRSELLGSIFEPQARKNFATPLNIILTLYGALNILFNNLYLVFCLFGVYLLGNLEGVCSSLVFAENTGFIEV